jgi:hypothetical protein
MRPDPAAPLAAAVRLAAAAAADPLIRGWLALIAANERADGEPSAPRPATTTAKRKAVRRA